MNTSSNIRNRLAQFDAVKDSKTPKGVKDAIERILEFEIGEEAMKEAISYSWEAAWTEEMAESADFSVDKQQQLTNLQAEPKASLLARLQSLYNEVRRAGARSMSIASELRTELQNKACTALTVLDFEPSVAVPSGSFRGHSSPRLTRSRGVTDDVQQSADSAEGMLDFSRVEWTAFVEDSATTGASRLQSIVLLPSIEVGDDVDLPELLVLVDGMPTGEGCAHDPGISADDGEFVLTFDGLPPVLAFLAVTLEDGTVVVNFRTAPPDDGYIV